MKSSFPFFLVLLSIVCSAGCRKGKSNSENNSNHSPVVNVSATLVKPFIYFFKATASDVDGDKLTYTWDFGEGTIKTGADTITFSYPADKTFLVKVKATDTKSASSDATVNIDTKTISITIDIAKQYQTIDGFGGFGSQKEAWSGGPFTSPEFVNTIMNDLGLTILRVHVPTNFEIQNDNSDPYVTDLTKFNINNNTPGHDDKLADHLNYLKQMKAAGLTKLIASIWTPPTWMKYNNKVGNGTTNQNSAPAYTTSPDANTNQLKTDMYQEFAEYCVAYIKIIKQETGIDLYALSIQNEPRFSQFYGSCVYNGAAMRDVIKVVGKRLEDEGLTTKLFIPEDVGWFDGIKGLVDPVLADAESRKYVDIIAVHGYANDGVTAGSTDAQTWQAMYNWGKPYNMPLWMTETSGFENNLGGAIKLARAMYIALKYGNASAWLHWSLSTTTLDSYSLMSASGEKSKRFYVSKNFYRFIRPGAIRAEASVEDGTNIYTLAFLNAADNSTTIVLINDQNTDKPIRLLPSNLTGQFQMLVTSATDNCKDYGMVDSKDILILKSNSVTTLYKKD